MKRISSRLALLIGLSWLGAANAATYYVSTSRGNDINAGTTPEAPWQTIAKLNRTVFSTSDRVYFRVGDEWDDEFLTVNWHGTPAAHAVVGAYYSDSAGVVSYGAGPGNQRPVINDHYRWGGYTFSSATGSNAGIDVSGSYVDVENLEIAQSGWGIRVVGGAQTDVTIANVFIDGAYQCGIQAQNVTNLTIQHSELFDAEAFRGLFHQPGNWCSTIGIQGSHGILVQDNYIHESWGEGINAFYGSTDAVIRNNLLYANWAAGIYMGALNDADIYGNLILGTADEQFWRTPLSSGPGIAMDNEAYEFVGGPTDSGGEATGEGSLCPLGPYGHYAESGSVLCPSALQNIHIYDNLVAGTAAGVAVWFAHYGAAYTNVGIFNNTFVDNEQQLNLGGQNVDDFAVENNIFLSLTPGMLDVDGSNYGIVFASNYWSQGEPRMQGSTPIGSATDVVGGAELFRMSGWRSIANADQAAAGFFAPQAGSTTLGKGTRDGLFFDSDFFGASLRNPVDLGAIAGIGQPASSAPQPVPVPAAPPTPLPAPAPPLSTGAVTAGTVTPNPAGPGQTITVAGNFTATTSADDAVLYLWLTRPDGHYVVRTAVVADFQAGVPTPVMATLAVPANAPAGDYTIAAGAYSGSAPMRPYVIDFARARIQ